MERIAVFVELTYQDTGRVRVWAKTAALGHFVLMSDEPTDNNAALSRQLKCSSVVHALVRLPGVMRLKPNDLKAARFQRDNAMIRIADRIVIFGSLEPWDGRLLGKQFDHYPDRIEQTQL